MVFDGDAVGSTDVSVDVAVVRKCLPDNEAQWLNQINHFVLVLI